MTRTRAPSKRTRARIAAELDAPLPPVAETLAMLEALSTHTYETKARTRAALKLAHHTLHELLRHIDSSARYSEELISRVSADSLHRRLRSSLQLDKPKRFPPLPRPIAPSPPRPPREVIAAAAPPPPAGMSAERAAELFTDDGLEFDETERGGAR